MSKTFKVIWNSSKQTCSVVSELSRSHAKSSSTTIHSTFSKIFKLSAIGALLSSVSLFANAESYQVVGGEIETNTNAIAIGKGSKVTKEAGANRYGRESIAVGDNAHANSDSSTVIGTSSTSKNSSVTVGTESSSAEKAVAVGAKTNASGGYSVAIGHKAETTTNQLLPAMLQRQLELLLSPMVRLQMLPAIIPLLLVDFLRQQVPKQQP
ncbi:ESPR-type extended signal peptide-containing protein [Aggregatibacter aphrophilus]|uniref:ESPR-type extended signal peptide-containing protein n=1 Tax=Aggregatibacter aphrophilus TaxID=732 RepID=UPI000D655537|nr:ESPR-type extended signal peptide-containing protein [Aggregatibacter aphrophilus]